MKAFSKGRNLIFETKRETSNQSPLPVTALKNGLLNHRA